MYVQLQSISGIIASKLRILLIIANLVIHTVGCICTCHDNAQLYVERDGPNTKVRFNVDQILSKI